MSLGIDFKFLDEQGNVKGDIRRVGATSNYKQLNDLKFLSETLNEFINHPMPINLRQHSNRHMIEQKLWKYAVPHTVPEYMFDLETGQLLPNKFKKGTT